MKTVVKVLGIIALVWIAFTVLGWVLGAAFTVLFWMLRWALVIGAVLFVGSAAYVAVKSKSSRHAIDR